MSESGLERAPAPVEVVVIVASAGGLNAIVRVLRDLPADFATPVVVGQHLGGQVSQLVPILASRTPLQVVWAQEGTLLRAGVVTVAPPRMRLEVLPDRSCTLQPFTRIFADRPLDALLSSVADSFGARVIAIVLTGMGKDGAAGAGAVHAAGGTVLVQDEETADQPAMPRAVVEAGVADRVLPLHDIGRAALDLVIGRGLPPARADVAAAQELFAEGGEVARLGRELDWGATPLGPVSEWPATLRTTVQVALLAPMAMCVLWGRSYVQIYNDAYREIMGVKHPAGLGQSNRDCWPEVWHLNEGLYARVLAGEAIELQQALYPITRSAVLEDAWFDLFFIPIREGTAAVGGILAAVVEKTREVLAARRLSTLHQLTDRTAGATTWKAALKGAIAVLAAAEDVPFEWVTGSTALVSKRH
jgi:hypothetical protein